jgi:hypothetical protein
MAMEIDICIVAGRRPELLRKTLESFGEKLFGNFIIKNVIANIDPVFGNEAEHQQALNVVRSSFPAAIIHEPAHPNFCEAVRRNWTGTSSSVIFHMEDDWLLNAPIYPSDLLPFSVDPLTVQISLNAEEKNWDSRLKGDVAYKRRRMRLLGMRLPFKRKVPIFTTAPSFLRGDFARQAAKLMNPSFDPEKQFFWEVNPALEKYVRPSRNKIIGNGPDFPITDIGRKWRDERNIQKQVINSNSIWTSKT